MSTAFDALLDAFEAALAATPVICSNILTDDPDPLSVDDTEAIVVSLGVSDPQQLGQLQGNPVDWATEVHVKCFAAANATSARPAAHTLMKSAYARLAADPSLGIDGVFIGEPAISRESDRAATRTYAVTLTYNVQHRTTSLTLA